MLTAIIPLSLQRAPFGIQKEDDRPVYPLGWQISKEKIDNIETLSKIVADKYSKWTNTDLLKLYKELENLKAKKN